MPWLSVESVHRLPRQPNSGPTRSRLSWVHHASLLSFFFSLSAPKLFSKTRDPTACRANIRGEPITRQPPSVSSTSSLLGNEAPGFLLLLVVLLIMHCHTLISGGRSRHFSAAAASGSCHRAACLPPSLSLTPALAIQSPTDSLTHSFSLSSLPTRPPNNELEVSKSLWLSAPLLFFLLLLPLAHESAPRPPRPLVPCDGQYVYRRDDGDDGDDGLMIVKGPCSLIPPAGRGAAAHMPRGSVSSSSFSCSPSRFSCDAGV